MDWVLTLAVLERAFAAPNFSSRKLTRNRALPPPASI
jgi:hypothetical protein